MSRVQGAVTSPGSELKRTVRDKTQEIEDLDRFLEQNTMPEGMFVASHMAFFVARRLWLGLLYIWIWLKPLQAL